MAEDVEIPEFLKKRPKPVRPAGSPRRQQKPGVIRRTVGMGVAAGAITLGTSIVGGLHHEDKPAVDTQDANPNMTQVLTANPHDQTPPIYYESFGERNLFDRVFHNQTLQEREAAQKTVQEMEAVVSQNQSYKGMVAVVSKHENLIRETAKKYEVPQEIALGIAL